tara:strand:- start:3710 stop:4030 length:321 start_codon:yes stop_codon:yes gene_type:complete
MSDYNNVYINCSALMADSRNVLKNSNNIIDNNNSLKNRKYLIDNADDIIYTNQVKACNFTSSKNNYIAQPFILNNNLKKNINKNNNNNDNSIYLTKEKLNNLTFSK